MTGSTVVQEDGALVVELTKSAFEALRREFRSQLDHTISDLALGDSRERKRLNAAADALHAIGRAQSGWEFENARDAAAVKAVKFGAEAVEFLREQRDAVAGRVDELATSGEADYGAHAEEVFLHYVLDRVLTEGVAG